MRTEQPPPAAGPPPQVRLAGWSVGTQGLLGVVFAVVLATRAAGAGSGPGAAFGEAGYFALVGAALVGVGWGLVRGRRGARPPAVVAQLLLLPFAYSLIGPAHQLLLGALSGAVVITTFLLLISERSRTWAVALHERDARR